MWIAKNSQLTWKIVPIILLIIALVLTASIYGYNNYLEWKNALTESNIAETKEKIENIQKDPNLQVYKLITDNRSTMDKLTAQSQVTTFIERFTEIENKYFLNFGTFNYASWVITTDAVTSSDSSLASYSIITDFIKWYRSDRNTYFTLPFISAVNGSDSMKFNVVFDVKDVLPENADENEKTEAKVETSTNSTKQAILEANRKKAQN